MNNIIFTLSPEEVKTALFTARVIKPYKTKAIVIIAISIILCATMFRYDEPQTYLIPVVLLVTDIFMLFGYRRNEENVVKSSTTGEEMVLYLYDTYINVVVKAYDANWNILKADVGNILENEEQIIITLVDSRLIAIPKRVLNDENKPLLEAVLNYFNNSENEQIDESTGEIK